MRTSDALVRGVPAGAAAVAASYAYAGLTREFVAAPASRFVVRYSPDAVVTFAITNLGSAAQPLILAGAVLATAALFAAVGAIAWLAGDELDRHWVGVPLGAALAAGLGYALTATWESGVVMGTGVAVVLAVFAVPFAPVSGEPRRRVLRGAAGVAAAAGAGWLLARRRSLELRPRQRESGPETYVRDAVATEMLAVAESRGLGAAGIDPLVSRGFYEVDIAVVDPTVPASDWRLTLSGAGVDASYSLADLRAFDVEHRFVTLRCVGESLNGYKLDNALWTGVRVEDVLADASAPENCCVMGRAADDYAVQFPREAVRDGLLAFGMNGQPLPRGHGSPVRLLVPGHWGETNVKWLTELELQDEVTDGYWEQRGWHGTGPVNTVAKLHGARRDGDQVTVSGHAYAGTRGVSAVEVSTDGGGTWTEAELSERLPGARADDGAQLREYADDAWRQWRYAFTASEEREVVVRAVEADGTVQPEERREAFPSGASGWVSRRV